MKRDLVDILACPVCKEDLELSITEENGREIVSDNLRCPHCEVLYPIDESTPNLLTPDKADNQ